jgi:iron complex transport system ATP-binding protein
MKMIRLDKIQFHYDPGETVLNDLSLMVEEGSISAILGPNGTGKTTLLHTILGLLAPQTGEVLIARKAIGDYSRVELSRIVALVPQSEVVPFNFNVLEYVLLGRTPQLGFLEMPGNEDIDWVREQLALLEISHLESRLINELSGGEQQMVVLARALAQQPKVLLLDEPTSHLDLSNKGKLLRMLRLLAKKQVTIVFSTHDPNMAAMIADHVVLLKNGAVLDAGDTADILTAEKLTWTYDTKVKVIEVDGRRVALLADENLKEQDEVHEPA